VAGGRSGSMVLPSVVVLGLISLVGSLLSGVGLCAILPPPQHHHRTSNGSSSSSVSKGALVVSGRLWERRQQQQNFTVVKDVCPDFSSYSGKWKEYVGKFDTLSTCETACTAGNCTSFTWNHAVHPKQCCESTTYHQFYCALLFVLSPCTSRTSLCV
jgi:hypothetical protein